MSTTCEKEFTITVQEGEIPLNSAVYEPNRDRIYAVRDNWVFEMSATTGAKVSQHRFAQPGIAADTYIDYDSTTDRLWTAFWRDTGDSSVNENLLKYIVKINPADITDVTLYPNTGAMTVGGVYTEWGMGPGQIITRGGIGWFWYSTSVAFRTNLGRINLVTPAITHTGGPGGAAGTTWLGGCHTGSELLVASNGSQDITRVNPANLATLGILVGPLTLFPYGVTYTGSTAYWATATQFVVKTGPTQIDLGRPNANPHNIRYNSNDGLIYIPLYRDDTIAVLNPADDSFVIKAGFTSPFDVVFTPTKKFAVQHSSIGLKEIT